MIYFPPSCAHYHRLRRPFWQRWSSFLWPSGKIWWHLRLYHENGKILQVRRKMYGLSSQINVIATLRGLLPVFEVDSMNFICRSDISFIEINVRWQVEVVVDPLLFSFSVERKWKGKKKERKFIKWNNDRKLIIEHVVVTTISTQCKGIGGWSTTPSCTWFHNFVFHQEH